jgi:hypothetical protein
MCVLPRGRCWRGIYSERIHTPPSTDGADVYEAVLFVILCRHHGFVFVAVIAMRTYWHDCNPRIDSKPRSAKYLLRRFVPFGRINDLKLNRLTA